MNLAIPESAEPIHLRFEVPISDEDLLRFCAENETARIERDANGELVIMSPTGFEGSGAELEVAAQLRNWAVENRQGNAYGPTAGVKLRDSSVRAADASWVSLRKSDALTREEREGFAPLCPEFVIEVRSKSDRLSDVRAKMLVWLQNGVELAWLIDPQRKAVEIYRPGREMEELVGASAVQGEGPVEGFVLELARVWG